MNSPYDDATQTIHRVPVRRSVNPVKDPSRRLKLEAWERGAIVLATAVLAFGGASGNMIVAIAGALGLLLTIVAMSYMPDRKARREEREKHPESDWVEDHGRAGAGVALGIAWVLVIALVAGILFFFPSAYALTGGVLAAGLSALIMFIALLIADN